jgi:hypothetical protein
MVGFFYAFVTHQLIVYPIGVTTLIIIKNIKL